MERLDGAQYERLDEDCGQRRQVLSDALRHESFLVLLVATDGAGHTVGQHLQQRTTRAVPVQSDHRPNRFVRLPQAVLKFRLVVYQYVCSQSISIHTTWGGACFTK